MSIGFDWSDGDFENSPSGFEDEYDEWGNRIDWIDGFQFIDVDKALAQEKAFEQKLKHLSELSPAKKAKLRKSLGM